MFGGIIGGWASKEFRVENRTKKPVRKKFFIQNLLWVMKKKVVSKIAERDGTRIRFFVEMLLFTRRKNLRLGLFIIQT